MLRLFCWIGTAGTVEETRQETLENYAGLVVIFISNHIYQYQSYLLVSIIFISINISHIKILSISY